VLREIDLLLKLLLTDSNRSPLWKLVTWIHYRYVQVWIIEPSRPVATGVGGVRDKCTPTCVCFKT